MNPVEAVAQRDFPNSRSRTLEPLQLNHQAPPALCWVATALAAAQGFFYGYALADMIFGYTLPHSEIGDVAAPASGHSIAELISARSQAVQ